MRDRILPEYYPQFGHAPWKTSANPVLSRKSLKTIHMKGRQIIRLPGGGGGGATPPRAALFWKVL